MGHPPDVRSLRHRDYTRPRRRGVNTSGAGRSFTAMSEEDKNAGAAVALSTDRAITSPARALFAPDQVGAIRRTVAKDCDDNEFVMFLELAARYGLDPFARQIWAAKMGGQNGPVTIFVGRDGLLSIAERHEDYEGMEGDVVREGDTLERTAAGVVHTYVRSYAKPTGESPPRPAERRIVGAWARVHRRGRRPTFFYAPISEYKPTGRRLEVSPWSRQESAMILKCAESMALRKAFSVSGLVPEEETRANRVDLTAVGDEPDWGEGALGEWLEALAAEANRVDPGSHRPARMAMLLRGATDFEREALATSLSEFVAERGGEVPARPEPEGEPLDAVVVDEPQAGGHAA